MLRIKLTAALIHPPGGSRLKHGLPELAEGATPFLGSGWDLIAKPRSQVLLLRGQGGKSVKSQDTQTKLCT